MRRIYSCERSDALCRFPVGKHIAHIKPALGMRDYIDLFASALFRYFKNARFQLFCAFLHGGGAVVVSVIYPCAVFSSSFGILPQ